MRAPLPTATLLFSAAGLSLSRAQQETPSPSAGTQYYIQEYRVQGSRTLPPLVVEEAVYPFMGRARTASDVEQARAALEKAYHSRGYQAVTVEIPPQDGAGESWC